MSVSESQRKAHKKYFDKAWSQVKLSMPNDEAAALRQYCSDHGLTVAGLIRGLVRDAIAADPAGAGAGGVQASPAAAGQGTPGGVLAGAESPPVTISCNRGEEKPLTD